MTGDKASTLRLLKEGMGKTVKVLENEGEDSNYVVRAHLPGCSEESLIPIMFLITTLAFLEATPVHESDGQTADFSEVDGWTPADFLSYLRFEKTNLKISLGFVRGRAVFTEVHLSSSGSLSIHTQRRGQSATRWLAYVQGRTHLREVTN